MHKKLIILFIFFFPTALLAQIDSLKSGKIELSVNYSAQCPLYSVNTPLDLVLSQDTRYRSKFGIGINYYPFERWFVGYSSSFSQEGGGYKNQKTNANYFKNSLLIGYSSLRTNRVVFSMFCGIEMNFLLNARLVNTISSENENVSEYYNKSNLSFPIGLGLKTNVYKGYYFNCYTFVSFSPYKINRETYIRVSQIIFPAFQFGISKFIK